VVDLSLWREFLESRNPKTRRNYEDSLSFFVKANGFRDIGEAVERLKSNPNPEALIAKYVQFLRRRGVSPNTIHLYLVPIRHLCTLYDIAVKWLKIKSITPRKRTIRNDRPVPRNIVKRVLTLLRPSKRLLIWFLYATGARVGEALDLKVKNLSLEADPPRALVMTEKTYHERVVFIPRDLASELREWVKNLEPEHYVFYSEKKGPSHKLEAKKVREAFQRALLRLGYLERDDSGKGWAYTIHGLRDNYKTLMTHAGMNGLIIETLLGHDTGIDRSYYKPSLDQLANEWRKYEQYLILEHPGEGEDERISALESKIEALEHAVKLYESIFEQIAKRNPRILKELGLE